MMTVNNDAEADAWEIVSDLLSDAYENFEKAGDEEMAESLHKAFDAMEKDENNSWHIVFANRVHARSKNYMKQPINKVMFGTFMSSFWVMNYDYDMFVWAQKRNLDSYISNLLIEVPKDVLNDKEIAMFELQMKKDK
jgi:hypothetical protein